eukprot:1095698-Alexandrium_andersonii.AAC.1
MASPRGRCASTSLRECPTRGKTRVGCWQSQGACRGVAAGLLVLPPGGPTGGRGTSEPSCAATCC